MSKRIEVSGSHFIVTDTVTSLEDLRIPTKDVRLELRETNFYFYDALDKAGVNHSIPFANTVDSEDAAWADEATLVSFIENNTGFNTASGGSEVFPFAAGDEDTNVIVENDIITFQMPNFATTLLKVSINMKVGPAGSSAIYDFNVNGVSALLTLISIDDGDKTSEDSIIPLVIDNAEMPANAIITIDRTQIGSGTPGTGTKGWLYYKKA